MQNSEEYVLQFASTYNHDFFVVDGTNGGFQTSSYMSDIKHYGSLELAKLAVKAYRSRNGKEPIRIIRITQEIVKVDKVE